MKIFKTLKKASEEDTRRCPVNDRINIVKIGIIPKNYRLQCTLKHQRLSSQSIKKQSKNVYGNTKDQDKSNAEQKDYLEYIKRCGGHHQTQLQATSEPQ